MNQIKGTLAVKGETQHVSDKFAKRTFVLITDAETKFPQKVELQLVQDKCNLLDNINIGDIVIADYNIRGREWLSPKGETKYFVTIEAWKLIAESPVYADAVPSKTTKGKAIAPEASEFSDLPF